MIFILKYFKNVHQVSWQSSSLIRLFFHKTPRERVIRGDNSLWATFFNYKYIKMIWVCYSNDKIALGSSYTYNCVIEDTKLLHEVRLSCANLSQIKSYFIP